jgi:hypothetical protein
MDVAGFASGQRSPAVIAGWLTQSDRAGQALPRAPNDAAGSALDSSPNFRRACRLGMKGRAIG